MLIEFGLPPLLITDMLSSCDHTRRHFYLNLKLYYNRRTSTHNNDCRDSWRDVFISLSILSFSPWGFFTPPSEVVEELDCTDVVRRTDWTVSLQSTNSAIKVLFPFHRCCSLLPSSLDPQQFPLVMQMGCIVTTISEVWAIVSPWGVFSSPCRNSIVCHYSTSILRMNTVMHINVLLKWVFSPSHITWRELPFVFDLLLKVVDSLKPLHLLDIYAKLDLLLSLTRGKFIHKTTTCLESRSSFWSQFLFLVLSDVFPERFFKFHHWPVCWADSFHSVSEAECMIAFLQFLLPLCLRSWMLSRHSHV